MLRGDSSLSVGRSFELLSVEVLLQWVWGEGFELLTKFELFVLSCFNWCGGVFSF